MLHWQDQVRKHEALDPTQNAFQDHFKLAMLQNAVNPIEELRIVKTQAEQLSVRNGKNLTSVVSFGLSGLGLLVELPVATSGGLALVTAGGAVTVEVGGGGEVGRRGRRRRL